MGVTLNFPISFFTQNYDGMAEANKYCNSEKFLDHIGLGDVLG